MEKQDIQKEESDGFIFQYLEKEPLPTWQMNGIIYKAMDILSIITIFPGIMAPPLPNEFEKGSREYESSFLFW